MKDCQHHLSILQLTQRFPDEASAEQWFIEQRWCGEITCPKCGSCDIQERPTRKPQPFRCRDCRRDFSVKTDSLMHSSPLPCRTWVFAIYLFGNNPKGISSVQMGKLLGISQKSAWHLIHRMREAFNDEFPVFDGIVEVDEAHIGGRFRAMHAKKREENRLKPNYGKTIVAGVRERESGRFWAAVVPDVTLESIRDFIGQHVSSEAFLYTDDAPVYDSFPHRASVNHSAGQYVDGEVTTNGIESLWATFKRAYWGTWHWVSPQHLQAYLNECCGRLNLRGLSVLDRMGEIARGMDGKRLTFVQLVS